MPRPTLVDVAGNYSDSLGDLLDLQGRLLARARRDDEGERDWLMAWAREVAQVARRKKQEARDGQQSVSQ